MIAEAHKESRELWTKVTNALLKNAEKYRKIAEGKQC